MKLKSYQRVECLCIPFTQVIILLRFVYNLISTCLSGIGLFLLNCLNCSTVRCFDLRKAQLFEYTIAHMIDKNFESALDFLHVLPGAWSCYRYEALQCREKLKKNVLQEHYLKTVLHPDKGLADFKEANMYLAEDRILCLAIFTQENKDYTLKYIPKAEAKTDAIEDLIEFMNQRRRWINSTWFALEYVLRNYWVNLEKSGHSRVTKWVKTPISMLFARLGKINAYIQLSLMYFVIHFSCFEFLKSSIQDKSLFLSVLPGLIPFFYVLMVIFLVLISLFYKVSNPTLQRPPDSRFPDQKTKIKRILSLMDPGISSSLSQTFSDLENQLQYVCFFILNLLSEKQQQKYQDIYVHEQQKRKLAPQNEINNHQIVIQDRGEETLQYQNELNKIKGQLKEDYKREDLDFQMLTEGFANDQEACFNIFLQLGLYYISGQTLDFIKLADLRQITRDIILFRNNQQVLRFLKIDIKAALTIDQIIEYFFGKSKQTELQDKYEEGLKKYDISILTNKVFTVISSILGYYYLLLWGMIINTVVGNYIITQKNETSLIILGGMIGISIGSVFLIICFHLVSPRRVWDIVRSTISYIYFSGCYTHTLIVYAFCNIDDVGWGTKGISSNVDNSYRQAKLNFVSTWLFCNALIAFLLILLDQFLNSSPYILYALGVYASFIMGVRFIFAAWYHWKYYSSQFFLCFISLPQQNKEKFDLEWASYQINNSKNVPKKRQRQGNITQN